MWTRTLTRWRYPGVIPLLAGLLWAAPVAAQQEEAEAGLTADTAAETTAEATAESPAAEEPREVDTGEPPSRFIPTEEISEDLSVSFPADI